MPNKVTLRGILDEDLDDVYRFVSKNFDPGVKLETWRLAFYRSWMHEKPNNGFILVADKTIVGVFCALYSQQQTRKGIQNVCNTSTWFVMDTYRSHSLKLMAAMMDQKGFLFTSLSFTKHSTFKDIAASIAVFAVLSSICEINCKQFSSNSF